MSFTCLADTQGVKTMRLSYRKKNQLTKSVPDLCVLTAPVAPAHPDAPCPMNRQELSGL